MAHDVVNEVVNDVMNSVVSEVVRLSRRLSLISEAAAVVVLLTVAAGVRWVLVGTGVPTFVTPDSDDYLRPGLLLATGRGFEPELRRTPLYPLFLAAVLAASPSLSAIAVVQHALGVLTVGVTYALGRATFGPIAGFAAGAAIAVSGPQLINEHYVMSEALFTLMATVSLAVTCLAVRSHSGPVATIAGVAAGLAGLTRPIGLLFVGIALLAMAAVGPRRAQQVMWCALGVALALGPWSVRNLVVHGSIGADGALGQALIGRTIRHDKGFVYDDPSRPDPDPIRSRAREIIQEEARGDPSGGTVTARIRDELGLSQAQTSRMLRDLAVDAIVQRPGYYLAGTASMARELFEGKNERLLGHWRQRVNRNWDNKWEPELVALLDKEIPAEGRPYARADAITSAFQPWRWHEAIGWTFLGGTLAAIAVRRWRLALVPASAVVLGVAAAAALDGPVWRFRYPLDPAMFVVCAGPVVMAVAAAGSFLRRSRHVIVERPSHTDN
jgi:hypothetical protein